METVILIGVQAAGKTTFYRERFFDTHIRISLDMLRTRHRERVLLRACIEARQRFVIDNTNPLKLDRLRYIAPASEAGFRISGYFFQTELVSALARNQERSDKPSIPIPGVVGTFRRIEPPSLAEGFHRLYQVQIDPSGGFVVTPYGEE